MRATILGCGSSTGVPRIGNDWGACNPNNPKNRRRRCSLLVQSGETTILIDTSPDLREQMLDADVKRLDAVFYTHAHADQAHGIDDLRMFYLTSRKQMPVYADSETLSTLKDRFGYCFAQVLDYSPILEGNLMEGSVVVGDGAEALIIEAFTVRHGRIDALCYCVTDASGKRLAYAPDVSGISDPVLEAITGIDVFICDALRYREHPSHAHLDKTLEWMARVSPNHGVLTNMHIDLDFEAVKALCPESVEPGYDGMMIRV